MLIAVEAVSVENVDRAIVDGTHYTSEAFQAAFPPSPASTASATADGTLVGFGGTEPPYGTLAEWAIVPEAYAAPIPDGIAPEVAATMATAISAMSMRTAAGLEPGETVLIQGATGVAGGSRCRSRGCSAPGGSSRPAGTTPRSRACASSGRRRHRHEGDDDASSRRIASGGRRTRRRRGLPVGQADGAAARALVPDSFTFRPPVRLVQIGAAAGTSLQLDAESLRTSGLEIYGASKGLAAGMAEAYAQVVEWTRTGELRSTSRSGRLSDIESAWQRTDLRGSRLVVVPDRVLDERTSVMSRIEASPGVASTT